MFGRHVLSRTLSAVILFALGVFIGLVTGTYHRWAEPFGLIAGLFVIAVFAIALRMVGKNRTVMFVGLLGTQLSVLAMALGLYRGFFILDDTLGWVFSLGMIAISLVVLAWPDLRDFPRYDGKSTPQPKGNQ